MALFGPAQRPAPVEIAAAEVARAFPKALPDGVKIVLDGVGVARVMLPMLKRLPQVRAVVSSWCYALAPGRPGAVRAVSGGATGAGGGVRKPWLTRLNVHLQQSVAVLRSASTLSPSVLPRSGAGPDAPGTAVGRNAGAGGGGAAGRWQGLWLFAGGVRQRVARVGLMRAW